jgi:hypothetical protein
VSYEHPYTKACREASTELAWLRAVTSDAEAFWDAIYPHIDEDGPDLNLHDCECIVAWLTASRPE